MEENNNIYPIFDRMLTRQDKEELLKQRGVMLWLSVMKVPKAVRV